MSIVATVIWIAVGVYYLIYKGFLGILGSQFLSFLSVVLCAAGIFFVAAVGHYSDSMTVAFMAAAGLVELLAFVLTRLNSKNEGLCQFISLFLMPLTGLLGILEMLNDEKWWLALVIVPVVLYSIVKICDIVKAYRKSDVPHWAKSEQPREEIAPEVLDEIRREVDREFPSREQVDDIVRRYNLPRHYSQYSHEVYSRWREEEVQRRVKSLSEGGDA